MKALICNDDGITASGILAAKKAVEGLCDTYVVAPEHQQSGIGHALTLNEPLRINEHILRDGSVGYGITGTPTDAVTLALFEIMDEKPDIMISGINTGFNIVVFENGCKATDMICISVSSQYIIDSITLYVLF